MGEHICKTKCSNERQKRLNAKDGGKRSMCDVPGDGICNIREVASYQAFYQVFGHSQKPGCKSKMILEMFDCIDDPLFSMGGQVEHAKRFKKQCEGSRGEHDCLAQISQLGTVLGTGGVCCPKRAGPSTCDGRPPATCNADCAKQWVPFYKHCGEALVEMIEGKQHKGEQAHAATLARLRTFSKQCIA